MSFTSHVEWSLDLVLRAIVPMVLWGTWTKFSFAVLSIMAYSRACDDKNAEVCSSPWETVWGTGGFVYVLMH